MIEGTISIKKLYGMPEDLHFKSVECAKKFTEENPSPAWQNLIDQTAKDALNKDDRNENVNVMTKVHLKDDFFDTIIIEDG
jgi:hypothetical protein